MKTSNWPKINELLSDGRLSSFRERIKYFVRSLIAAKYKPQLMAIILSSDQLYNFFKGHSKHLHSPLSYYLDRRWNVKERFSNFQYDLKIASRIWGYDIWKKLIEDKDIDILMIDEIYFLSFGVNKKIHRKATGN
jgi:uncharacterized protein VirK/YbjX